MEIIETAEDLGKFCAELKKQPFITVDLEFLREHTYYAKLCLIQVGSRGHCAVIDPLAPGMNLQPFFNLMTDPAVVKVFHSGRQDIEIIYNLSHQITAPLFDTQVAGMVTGFGEAVSYENLVAHILHIKLDKSNRLSDWSKRPLNRAQLEYALADVTHLVPVYEYLADKLEKLGRTDWIKEEMQLLSRPETYEVNPFDVWQKIKHRSHSARFLTILRELAAWREARAQRKNTPRQSFIKDETLLAICAICPQNKDELAQIRNLRQDVAMGRLGDEIIDVLHHALSIPAEKYVSPPKPRELQEKGMALFELLKLLLKIVSQKHGLVSRLVATDEDLKELCLFHDDNQPVLRGWRYEIFGQQALALRSGKLSIRYAPADGNIVFEQIG